MAAAGALRAGVGLLTLAASEASRPAAAALAPEAMFTALPQTGGTLSAEALAAAGIALERFDGIVLGPGLGRTPATAQLVEWILRRAPGRLLLDADALTLFAEIGSLSDGAPATQQRILTPHPGEAARLAGLSTGAVQAARSGSVRALADRYRATVVLKGSGTLVCDPGEEPWLNRTGNPGMATGGSGDVLAGIIGALWVQGLTSLQAATLGVWLHGCAGDRATWRLNTPSVTARDLLANLRFDPEQ